MRVGLLEGSGCDLDELAVLLELFDVVGACQAHTGTDAAQHLEDSILYAALIGYAAFDAFGNQLLGILLPLSMAAMEPMPR